jgi:hypothetical protein
MIRETYKGRQLKAIKGKSYGTTRIFVNGTDCGEWLGTQAEQIEWAKRTIDDVDSRPFEGRWSECWYEPGTYELNEHGHVVAPGGTCSCNYCEERRIQPCADIKVDGSCVCDHCMKPYLADGSTLKVVADGQNVEEAKEMQEQIEIGVRVSGYVSGQAFTGVVCGTGGRGGRVAISAAGRLTRIEPSEIDSVTVRTDNELTMPSGRKVKYAHVQGVKEVRALVVLAT